MKNAMYMSKRGLLEKELNRYSNMEITLKPVKYHKDIFPRLLNKYRDYGMVENSYCCYGLEHCCWQELVEEGIWDLTLEDVKWRILDRVKYVRKYLYNGRKYGSDRLYMYEDDEYCHVYMYLRDKIGYDYSFWFTK